MPASSAPQRSQYHSVGRFSVPHSPHLRVLATPAPPGFAGAVCVGASLERPEDPAPGLLRLPEDVAGGGAGAGFLSSPGATDLRNAISSSGAGGPWVISGSRGGGFGAGRAEATGGATGSGSGSGSGSGAGGTGGAWIATAGGGSLRLGDPLIRPWTSASRAISCPTPLSSPRSRF